jgi:hypothetical protein
MDSINSSVTNGKTGFRAESDNLERQRKCDEKLRNFVMAAPAVFGSS